MAAWSIRGARPKATLVPGNGPRRPKGMAIIEVDHIHKRYRDAVAVEDVSFAVERGEIFAILGPNGAGKTTAVEIVEGLRVPDRGTVRVLGLDPRRDRAELRRRVGVQLQQSQLPEQMKVWEALDLYSSFYERPRTGSGCWRPCGSPSGATPGTASCRVASSNGCRSPWRWSATRTSPSWTSSPRGWTRRRGATPGS
jgi:hypothetical protein